MGGLDRRTQLTILVAALGYFVDVFDIILFTLVRVPSLHGLGIPEDQMLDTGVLLINMQNAGLLIGGIAWGVLGDKRGRLSVLLGSILLYSLANIANGFVTSVEMYAALRFIAGVGLAGELGAGVTLASELMPKDKRGLGTTLINAFGFCGAFAAAGASVWLGWRGSYWLGGALGLLLLALRMGVTESGMFEKVKEKGGERGNLLKLLTNGGALFRILLCTLIGVPIWFVVGLVLTFTPEFARAFGMSEIPTVPMTVTCFYVGFVSGGTGSGLLSQYLKSRKRAIFTSLALLSIGIALYMTVGGISTNVYLGIVMFLGLAAGYWAMFVQVAAEQFGTNYRSTVATSVPNLVRGANILMTLAFQSLIPVLSLKGAGIAVAATVISLAVFATWKMAETFDRDLDFEEQL